MIKAVDADPDIIRKAMREQWEKLIFQPLCELDQNRTVLVVIDALDECDREGDIKIILKLLSQARQIPSVSLRFFLTSRPELPIRLGFTEISGDAHRDMALHEVPKTTVDHDLTAYLRTEFTIIRKNNLSRVPHASLPQSWPGDEVIMRLVGMASPLFIFAATVCRFVGEPRWIPTKRIETILNSKMAHLDNMYLPVLNQLLDGQSDREADTIAKEFREVVGTIILLTEPLSTKSLASLLAVSSEDIANRLDMLHSVLSIPTDEDKPVRLFHLSFRDTLVDPDQRGKSLFWIDMPRTHLEIARRCIDLLSRLGVLRENICDLDGPGTFRSEIDVKVIEDKIPTDARYACLYWVHHIEQSALFASIKTYVYDFLREKCLYWLEALSFLGSAHEAVRMTSVLQAADGGKDTLLSDIYHFVLRFAYIIDSAPLQLYSSCLVYAPKCTELWHTFKPMLPDWIVRLPEVEDSWAEVPQSLEGFKFRIKLLSFSPDGKVLAHGDSKYIKVWDVYTGAILHTIGSKQSSIDTAAASFNGEMVAYIVTHVRQNKIKVVSVATGIEHITLHGHSREINSLSFSSDGKLASSSRATFKTWDLTTGSVLYTSEEHDEMLNVVAFSPDNSVLISGTHMWMRLRNALSGEILWDHTWEFAAFTPYGNSIISKRDHTVGIFDTATGIIMNKIELPDTWICGLAVSPDGKTLIGSTRENISGEKAITFWDLSSVKLLYKMKLETIIPFSLFYSHDGTMLVASSFSEIKVWNMGVKWTRKDFHCDMYEIRCIAISPDGSSYASSSTSDSMSTLKLWNTTGSIRWKRNDVGFFHCGLTFSPDSVYLASFPYVHKTGLGHHKIFLYFAAGSYEPRTLAGHKSQIVKLAFSPDGKTLASCSKDYTVKIWNSSTGDLIQSLVDVRLVVDLERTIPGDDSGDEYSSLSSRIVDDRPQKPYIKVSDLDGKKVANVSHADRCCSLAYSPDSNVLASSSWDGMIKLWDSNGKLRQTISSARKFPIALAFSPDGSLLACMSYRGFIDVWHVESGCLYHSFCVFLDDHVPFLGRLSFTPCGEFFITNRGLRGVTCTQSTSEKPEKYYYVVDRWVYRGFRRLFWLPPEYDATDWAVHGSTIILGHNSGRVTRLEFAQGTKAKS